MAAQSDWLDVVHTGPGTLAGRYMRMFWHPVYRSKDLGAGQAVPIRIMSEDLTLFRGETGQPHIVAGRCGHRGTRLSTGWVEDDCIRCLYHGWRYDGSGQCVEQPGEDESFAAKVRLKSYPAVEYLGHVFTYMGPDPAPPLRRYPDFERPGLLEVGPVEAWPCNYFNRIDNAADAGHVPWTHRTAITRSGKADRLAVRNVSAEETEYGVRTASRVASGPPEYLHFHMPNVNQVRSQVMMEGSLADAASMWADRMFWRVPVDDDNSVSFEVELVHLSGPAAAAYQQRREQSGELPSAELNAVAEEVLAGKRRIQQTPDDFSTYKLFLVEDYATQVGQGAVADRENEHLGRIDSGLIMVRRVWQRELRALAEGLPLTDWREPDGVADMHRVAAVS